MFFLPGAAEIRPGVSMMVKLGQYLHQKYCMSWSVITESHDAAND
jgi:hypothetical protein